MTAAVRCSVTDCKFNGGLFCNKPILIIRDGICGELVDRYGNRIPPEQWLKQQQNTQQDVEEFCE